MRPYLLYSLENGWLEESFPLSEVPVRKCEMGPKEQIGVLCYCRMPALNDEEPVIFCSSSMPNCKKIFHLSCLQQLLPDTTFDGWVCADCAVKD